MEKKYNGSLVNYFDADGKLIRGYHMTDIGFSLEVYEYKDELEGEIMYYTMNEFE